MAFEESKLDRARMDRIIEQQERIAELEKRLAEAIKATEDQIQFGFNAEHKMFKKVQEAEKREAGLRAALEGARKVVAEQAEMESLWCHCDSIVEAHFQQELRRLHEAVEGKSQVECAVDALEVKDG